jgi:hypothetical protein
MAKEVTDAVHLLPPPIVIVTDGSGATHVVIEGDDNSERVPFETLYTVGEQGSVFDTEGRKAEADLIECARLFIEREGLTGTDPESLAIAAAEKPELKSALLALRVP